MAGHRQLVLPVQGLLLCILALHFCAWGPLATAEHEVANASVATNHTSVAVTKASVASSQAVATASTSVATNHALVATANSAVATSNQALAAAASTSVPATSQALVAAANTSAPATNQALVATANTSVAANTSVNTTGGTWLTCQSFQCSGERCYQDEAYANATAACRTEMFCELYRLSSTNYTARCSSACSAELCRTNGSASPWHCALECCNTSLCLRLNASSYGDLPPATKPPTTTTTTPRPPPRNGKICAAFSCQGDGCFRGKKATARCIVGQDFCEMKKRGLNYVAGCSKACKAAKPLCARGVKAACYQECCPASPKGSCLKLDGKVHVNDAGQVAPSLLLQLLVGAAILLLLSCGAPAPLRE